MRWVRRLVKGLPVAFGLLLLAAIAVVVLVRIELTVEAAGQIQINRYQIVRPRVAGIVSELLVSPGALVKPGQVLCRLLDYDFERQELELRQQLGDALSQRSSIEARERQIGGEVQPLERSKQEKELTDDQLETEAQGARTRESALALKRAEESLARSRQLREAGLLSEQAVKEVEIDKLQAQERYEQSMIGERQTRTRSAGAADTLALVGAQQRSTLIELSSQRAQLSILISQIRAQLNRTERVARQYTLAAEIGGVVVGSPVDDIKGKKVQAGDELFSIIDPSAVHFVTYVPEEAIVRVRAGQRALVELSGFPKRRFDVFQGEVQKIADQPQLQQVGTQILYPVEIRLERPWVRWEGNRFYVRSGMRGIAKISYRHRVPILSVIYETLTGEERRPSTQ